MRELTIGEKIFIDNHYNKLKPREMGSALEISNELVRGYMRSKGYESICRISPPRPLTEKDKEYIRTHSAVQTINQMAVKVRKRFNAVKHFIHQENLPNELSGRGRPAGVLNIKVHKRYTIIKQPLVRAPAIYSNPDWQKYGEELLKG